MRIHLARLSILITLLSCPALAALPLGFYSIFGGGDREAVEQLDAFYDLADRILWYDIKRTYSLGLKQVAADGYSRAVHFTFDEIEPFLQRERHKGLVLVHFPKTVMWNEHQVIAEHANKVIAQMKAVGYERVVILGVHAEGTHYIADTTIDAPPWSPGAELDSDPTNEHKEPLESK